MGEHGTRLLRLSLTARRPSPAIGADDQIGRYTHLSCRGWMHESEPLACDLRNTSRGQENNAAFIHKRGPETPHELAVLTSAPGGTMWVAQYNRDVAVVG